MSKHGYFLDDVQRDLVIGAIDVMMFALKPGSMQDDKRPSTAFARSFTAQRIAEVRALFANKDPKKEKA